jgi:hypothetical protein
LESAAGRPPEVPIGEEERQAIRRALAVAGLLETGAPVS